jgi:NAD(P)-dependent dehydrogenase (short-subunit alcohol dehydrogenase family)/alkylation response protein AidB-like acyl-CoA dehydrogenase
MKLEGKIAVVTGTSPNIGGGIAEGLAAEGAAVACIDSTPANAEDCAVALGAAGARAIAITTDITDERAVAAAFARVAAELGPVDILVNNAAVFNQKGVLDMPLAEWSRQLAVILDGAFLCTAAAARAMVERKQGGAIINVISTAGHQGQPRNVGYCTAKAGLLNFTRSVAMELAPHGIRVNSLTPTATDPSSPSTAPSAGDASARPSGSCRRSSRSAAASRCSGCRVRATTGAPWSTWRRTTRAASPAPICASMRARSRATGRGTGAVRASSRSEPKASEDHREVPDVRSDDQARRGHDSRARARDSRSASCAAPRARPRRPARSRPRSQARCMDSVVTCPIPEALGGQGESDLVTYLMVVEELAWGDPGIAYAALGAGHAALLIAQVGTPAQQQRAAAALPRSRAAGRRRAPLRGLRPRAVRAAHARGSQRARMDDHGREGRGTAPGANGLSVIHRAALRHRVARRFAALGEPRGLRIDARRPRARPDRARLRADGCGRARERRAAGRRAARGRRRGGARARSRPDPPHAARARDRLRARVARVRAALCDRADRVRAPDRGVPGRRVPARRSGHGRGRRAARALGGGARRRAEPRPRADRAPHANAIAHASEAALRATREGVQTLGGHGFITDYPIERWYRCAAALAAIDFDPRRPRRRSSERRRHDDRARISRATEALRERVREWSVQSGAPARARGRPPPRRARGRRRRARGVPGRASASRCAAQPGSPLDEAFRADGSYLVTALVQEAIAYGDGWPLWTNGGSIGQNVVKGMGTPAQKERWVGGIARGEMQFAAFALTEPHFGSDVAQVATTAVRRGDAWILNGSKMYCSMGASADYVVVFATIDKTAGRHGIRAFVVEKNAPGFRVTKRNEEKLGIRCAETSELKFEDCAVPLDHCLGWTGEAKPAVAATASRAASSARSPRSAPRARCWRGSASGSRAPRRTPPRNGSRSGATSSRRCGSRGSRTSSCAWTPRSITRAGWCCAPRG